MSRHPACALTKGSQFEGANHAHESLLLRFQLPSPQQAWGSHAQHHNVRSTLSLSSLARNFCAPSSRPTCTEKPSQIATRQLLCTDSAAHDPCGQTAGCSGGARGWHSRVHLRKLEGDGALADVALLARLLGVLDDGAYLVLTLTCRLAICADQGPRLCEIDS